MLADSNNTYDPKPHSASGQRTLFPFKSIGDFETETGVVSEEMTRWHNNGWLSFDPSITTEFDEPHWVEVEFVKGIIRAGLSDEWINALLSKLRMPYCYDSKRTFYSFTDQSWKTVPRIPEPEEVIEESLDSYLQDLADAEEWERLWEIKEAIDALLKNCPPNTR